MEILTEGGGFYPIQEGNGQVRRGHFIAWKGCCRENKTQDLFLSGQGRERSYGLMEFIYREILFSSLLFPPSFSLVCKGKFSLGP